MIRACSAVPFVAQPTTPDDRGILDRGGQCAPGDRPAYLTDHGAATEEIGRLRWTLTQVIALVTTRPG
jgi:hypothetical protein